MNAKNTRPQHVPMITLGDIYYILFRHKWKIAILTVLGVAAALLLPVLWPQSYQSEADLLIKYVADSGEPTGPGTDGSRMLYVDPAGRNIINTELHILSSMDLAQEVATNIGATNILGTEGSPLLAAVLMHANMLVDNPDGSDIVRIIYKHRDPQVAKTVLTQVVNTYLERHAKVHQIGDDANLIMVTGDWKKQLRDTEGRLSEIKSNLNIVSFEDAAKVFADQITRLQGDIFQAQTDLAQHEAILQELTKRSNEIEQHYANSNSIDTNAVAAGTNTVNDSTNTVARQPESGAMKTVPPEISSEYKTIKDSIDTYRVDLNALLKTYLPESPRVKDKRAQIAAAEQHKKQLEQENPGLIMGVGSDSAKSGDNGAPLVGRFVEEHSQIAALEKKIQLLNDQLKSVRDKAVKLDSYSFEIEELKRTRNNEMANVDYYQKKQAQATIDATYGQKSSNITVIQTPTAPLMDNGKLRKAQAGLAFAGILFGFGLAFLIEMYLDRTVKRPADIEAKLGVPLFLSIPYRNGKSNQRLLAAPPNPSLILRWQAKDRSFTLNGSKTTIGRGADCTVALEEESVSGHHCEIFKRNGETIVKDLGSANGTYVDGERVMEATLKPGQSLRVGNVELAVGENEIKALEVVKKSAPLPPWDPRHALRPFYDTLRDRLITYFEVKNLTHNPKLVALTSCGDRAGVSSTAAGLAAALSETGEGRVLLVDMNVERGAAHHFYKGHLSCGIDEALQKDTRDGARVQDNLYVVTESSSDQDSLPRALPKRFTNLFPKLKASDYDYIIFDMPPMSQISMTPRLARYMDMMMVVVESEKTDKDVVQRAVNMLTEANAKNVGVVLNKRKNYVPQQLQQEL